MYDPVTQVENEDVLSSIRRLISDNQWAQHEGHTEIGEFEIQHEEVQTSSIDKFVLTPALRVVEAEIAPEIIVDSNTEHTSQPDTEPVKYASETEQPSMDINEEVQSQFNTNVDDHAGMTKLERMIAELEATVTDQPDQWEPDDMEIEDLAAESAISPMQEAGDVHDADVIQPDEVEISKQTDTDIDDSSDDIDASLDDELDDFIRKESTVDEEVLREMVTDIVRQELQGALGERITRNVRKLVRREIYRVLNAQDFE